MPKDWCNLEIVKAFAIKLGKGQCVIKAKDRENYNITHYERALTESKKGNYSIVFIV